MSLNKCRTPNKRRNPELTLRVSIENSALSTQRLNGVGVYSGLGVKLRKYGSRRISAESSRLQKETDLNRQVLYMLLKKNKKKNKTTPKSQKSAICAAC